MRYVFGFAEGSKDDRELLGGKGANLAEMTALGLPVPPGFVLTTDLSPESERAFAPALALAERLGEPIVLLAVLEDLPFEPTGGGLVSVYPDRAQMHRDWQQKLREVAGRLPAKARVRAELVDATDVPRAICDFAQRERASYIAMASHGRGGMTDVYYGSVAAGVLQRIDRPLLIVRAQ